MNKTTIISALLALPMVAMAQGLKSNTEVYDMGSLMYEVPGKATFKIKNTAGKAVTIKDVETGCGCTTAQYPRYAVAAGKTFNLELTYDARQLGHFQKSVLVFTDAADKPLELTVKGVVVTASAGLEAAENSGNAVEIGDMLANENFVEFDDVNRGDRMVREIYITNVTDSYVEPVIMRLPSYLTTEITPSRLAPGKTATVRFFLDSNQLRSYGLNQTDVYLAANVGEKISEDKAITVSAVLLPAQIAQDDPRRINGPKIQLSETEVDMSQFAGKKKVKKDIFITNTGKSELEITAMQIVTPGVEVTLAKPTIMPGETTKLRVSANASVLSKVRNRPRVLMITNDPDNQKVEIVVKKLSN